MSRSRDYPGCSAIAKQSRFFGDWATHSPNKTADFFIPNRGKKIANDVWKATSRSFINIDHLYYIFIYEHLYEHLLTSPLMGPTWFPTFTDLKHSFRVDETGDSLWFFGFALWPRSPSSLPKSPQKCGKQMKTTPKRAYAILQSSVETPRNLLSNPTGLRFEFGNGPWE